MNEASVREALKGVPPPAGDRLARDVYGIVLKLAEAYQRETALRRGLEAVRSSLDVFGGSLDARDVERLVARINTALEAGPAVPGTGDFRAPEAVIETMLWEIQALRGQLAANQEFAGAVLQTLSVVPPNLIDKAFPALARDVLESLTGGNRRLLETETSRELLGKFKDPRAAQALVDVYGRSEPQAPAATATTPPATVAELPADALAHVQRIEAAWLRILAAANDLANVDTHEAVATRLAVLNMALIVAKEEICQVTGEEGRLAAALIITIGKETRALREGLAQGRKALQMMMPGAPDLQGVRRTTLKLLSAMIDAPSVLEQPSFKQMATRAGTDGRTIGGGICPVHGKVTANHSCLAYRPQESEESA